MTFVSTIGQSIDQIERIKVTQLQLADLQQQIATGKKSQTFAGLGTDIIASKRARENFTKLDNYVNNIDIADRRLKMMVEAMTEFKNQAEAVLNAIEIQTQQGEYEIEAVSDLARNTATFLNDLINTKDGDRYLFGGSETKSAPLGSTGSMQTYMKTQLNSWLNAGIDTDQLIASYRDQTQLTDTIIGYSAPLSAGTAKNVYVRVEDHTEINYTVFANQDGMRDIVAGVNMLAHIDQVMDEVTLDPDDPVGTITAPGRPSSNRTIIFISFSTISPR